MASNTTGPSPSIKAENSAVPFSYKRKPKNYTDPKERKLNNKELKAQKRKWREEKLILRMELEVKRKKEEEEKQKIAQEVVERKARFGRSYTVSIALPGSILDNAQSLELRAYLGGQIARAAAIFNVDEIVVFDEGVQQSQVKGEFKGLLSGGRANTQLFHILQYLECPQYLRKDFFPHHRDLVHAGLLNPLDLPHHLRENDWCDYREGVVLKKLTKDGFSCYAKIGLKKDVLLDMGIPPGKRVTVKLDESSKDSKHLRGEVVSPDEPREMRGLYWGYNSRLASCISDVFDNCPYEGGYDLLIGTSDKGADVDKTTLPPFQHALVVFGGLKGLEVSVEMDKNLTSNDPEEFFHHYVNVCPNQGSRTIRTEEAVLIAMASLDVKLTAANKSKSEIKSSVL